MAAEKSKILSRFIVLEGGDGSGTTTQLGLIGRALERAAFPHWTTSEPTDRPEGLLIRRILSGELQRDPGTLALLFAADRNEHLKGVGGILERLARGEIVLCDRYVLSSLAYQGVACGPDLPARAQRRTFPCPNSYLLRPRPRPILGEARRTRAPRYIRGPAFPGKSRGRLSPGPRVYAEAWG